MAGLGLPGPAPYLPSASSNRPLPTGPCNHNNVVDGACGCQQFWDDCSANLHQDSKEHRSSSDRSTLCVCGHHACFHTTAIAGAALSAPVKCDGRCRLLDAVQCDIHKPLKSQRDEPSRREGSQSGRFFRQSQVNATQRLQLNEASKANGSGGGEGGRDVSSEPSTSGLPRVPSMCLLSNDRHPAANRSARDDTSQSRQTVTGLGLSLMNTATLGNSLEHQHSVGSTIPDDLDILRVVNAAHSEPEIPSTRANSVAGEQARVKSPVPGSLNAILEQNRILHVDVSGDTVPNTFNPEDFIRSATEVATPSNANTPDLSGNDQNVRDGMKLIEGLMQATSNADQRKGTDATPANATSAPSPQLLLARSPKISQEVLQNLVKSASPQALQMLTSYLAPLHNLLNSIPNVGNTMSELNDRLTLLENNNSFNYVHPEELQQNFDVQDSRLIELENRLDEHDRLHQAIDADTSSHYVSRRRVATVTSSFDSNRSIQSTTSSALILAAMDRKDIATEMGNVKDRLKALEAAAMPTSLNPWEVEIVFLPWGRDLRGIWVSPDEPTQDPSKVATQDSEEWTQARSSTLGQSRSLLAPLRDTDSSPHPSASHSARSSHPFSELGWSSQAISDWASETNTMLLLPQACGSSNMVYQRLRSRGFIKNVVFKSASARDVQATLSQAFKGLLEHLKYNTEDENPVISSYPGLRAPFIPLRKVRGASRLHFLTSAEMTSSALWTFQFLASGVLMRVTGGKKRLYVTSRDAYIQPTDDIGSAWTWQTLRQLPRYQPDQDSQMEGNEEHCQPEVAEADAREACWARYEPLDEPLLSVNESFGSHHSVELSMRPADRQWRRSITPAPILKNWASQPISPLSEFHPRPTHGRDRTVSASNLDSAPINSFKRRLNSSPVKASPTSHNARAPSSSVVRQKRRRVANSPSPRPDATAGAENQNAQITLWNDTPRRSHEPSSPLVANEIRLPRTNSDLASRPSQRSAALVGKGTPFAYATPYSGPYIGGPGFGRNPLGNDDLYQDDDGDESWPGVTDGDGDSESDPDMESRPGIDPGSFSGDDSNQGSDEEDDSPEDAFGAQPTDVEDEEDEEAIFDEMLYALGRKA